MARFTIISLALVCVVSATRYSDKEFLRGQHFRLPAAIRPPSLYLEPGPDGNMTFQGIDKLLADWMAQNFKITYSYVPLRESDIARVGFRNTVIEMLLNGTIDMLTPPLTPTWDRTSFMDFTYAVTIEDYKITSPWPEEQSRLLAPVRPFELSVWFCLLASFVIVTLLLGALSRSSDDQLKSYDLMERCSRSIIYVITILLGQGDYLPFRLHSIRILLTGWCLMVLVLVNSYSGTLTSHLTLPVYTKTINSFEDLAMKADEMIVDSHSAFSDFLLDAKNGTYKVLGDSLRRHPDHQIKFIPEVLEKMFSGKYAYPSPGSYLEYLIANDYKTKHKCRLTLSKPLPFTSLIAYGLPKNGPYNQIINHQFMYLWEFGMSKQWFGRMYRGRFEQCVVKAVRPRMTVLKLQDLYSAFIILAFGTAVSLLVLIFEGIMWMSPRSVS